MAGLAFPVVLALTVEVVEQVHTATSVLTGVPTALIHIHVTQRALPAVRAKALERADPVNAGSSILTGRRHTVVYVLVTVCSSEARFTGTGEVPSRLADAASVWAAHIGRDVPHPFLCAIGGHGDSTTVNHFTGICLTVVLELRAGLALKVVRAGTVEVIHQTVTLGLVLARVRAARVALHLTGGASVPMWALTHEAVQQGVTPAPVPTWAAGTAVPLDVTMPAHKPW